MGSYFTLDNNKIEFERSFLMELKNKVLLDKLIDFIDNSEDIIGDEQAYLNKKNFYNFCCKFLNQNQIDRSFILFSDTNEKVLKFELYSLFIMLSKGSFEAKIHTIFNLFTINDEIILKDHDFILLIKSTVNSVYKICKQKIPSDEAYIMFFKAKCPNIFIYEDSE